jgi:sigma-B regulation protein RsbU (phosphoserine phosphatase)
MLEANYITLFYAEFDERSSRLNYVNAGHNPPLLVRQGISVDKLELGGTVLGLFREVEYEVGETEMKADDMIVAYTDGLVEARNATGEELGEERLIKLVRHCARLTASEAESSLLASVKEWTGGAEQEDDLTLVVIKRL